MTITLSRTNLCFRKWLWNNLHGEYVSYIFSHNLFHIHSRVCSESDIVGIEVRNLMPNLQIYRISVLNNGSHLRLATTSDHVLATGRYFNGYRTIHALYDTITYILAPPPPMICLKPVIHPDFTFYFALMLQLVAKLIKSFNHIVIQIVRIFSHNTHHVLPSQSKTLYSFIHVKKYSPDSSRL